MKKENNNKILLKFPTFIIKTLSRIFFKFCGSPALEGNDALEKRKHGCDLLHRVIVSEPNIAKFVKSALTKYFNQATLPTQEQLVSLYPKDGEGGKGTRKSPRTGNKKSKKTSAESP